jgi:molybdopterin/thiamine biosynthesis adenylyltransferase
MAKKTIWGFLQDQYKKVPPAAQADLKGKTVIVVGANTGLGFEAAQHFARMGVGKLILACRNQEKGEAAVQRGYTFNSSQC